jgi:DNA-binding MarR family transcriptional regulator
MPHSNGDSNLLQDLEAGFRAMSTAAVMLHDTVARHLNLNGTDHKCMGLLCDHGPMSAGDLAVMTGLTTGAVTGVVNRLEKAGYARRIPNPTDARSVIIQPVNVGAFLENIGVLLGPLRARMRTLVAQYSKTELRLILRFIREATQVSREESVRLAERAVVTRRFRAKDDRSTEIGVDRSEPSC